MGQVRVLACLGWAGEKVAQSRAALTTPLERSKQAWKDHRYSWSLHARSRTANQATSAEGAREKKEGKLVLAHARKRTTK